MKTSLEHLPEYKREELTRVVELILAAGSPEILILFGSYARGDWIEDRHFEGNTLVEYRSDYDLYALTRIAKHCDRLLLEPSLTRRFHEVARYSTLRGRPAPSVCASSAPDSTVIYQRANAHVHPTI